MGGRMELFGLLLRCTQRSRRLRFCRLRFCGLEKGDFNLTAAACLRGSHNRHFPGAKPHRFPNEQIRPVARRCISGEPASAGSELA
jgi:hypothetical protein